MTPQHHLPAAIARTSLSIITAELEALGLTPPPETAAVVKRVIHTTADFDYARNLRFTPGAVAAGVACLSGPRHGGANESALRMLEELRAAGGVPVVAHIFKYRFDDAQRAAMLAAAADAGALGVEVRYTTYTPEQTEIAQALAARLGLAPSGGSDYHGLRKPDIALGSGRGGLRVPYACLAGLKARAGHECV